MIASEPRAVTIVTGIAATAHKSHVGLAAAGNNPHAMKFSVAPERNPRLRSPAPTNAARPIPTAGRLPGA